MENEEGERRCKGNEKRGGVKIHDNNNNNNKEIKILKSRRDLPARFILRSLDYFTLDVISKVWVFDGRMVWS